MKVIDYDRIEEWAPWIDEMIFGAISRDFLKHIAKYQPEYIEDAADILYQYIDKKDLVNYLENSLKKFYVRVYHGTRLSQGELADIKSNGLRPLLLKERKKNLIEIFKEHSEWEGVKSNLDGVLHRLGPGEEAGRREDGNIYACFSRKGLLEGASHYLRYGAEVDGHVASMMFDDLAAARRLLSINRTPYLISFVVDFESALSAANPFIFNGEDIPSLLRQIVESWAYRKYKATFSSESLCDCTAAMFRGPRPSNELESIEVVSENSIIS
ncbi:hypothetical protein [Aliamphritea hakodatensis]|uniref:hypothetical protein n=1 Tax=Aliamphritea hakodatensis TaxID=2895352 RepID=UPI0022FD6C1E|nr:hypothetical protein [Aliamphritea hakodatensis]